MTGTPSNPDPNPTLTLTLTLTLTPTLTLTLTITLTLTLSLTLGLTLTPTRCALAAPLMLGNDPRRMSVATRRILMAPELLAINQDPLGKQVRALNPHLHPHPHPNPHPNPGPAAELGAGQPHASPTRPPAARQSRQGMPTGGEGARRLDRPRARKLTMHTEP